VSIFGLTREDVYLSGSRGSVLEDIFVLLVSVACHRGYLHLLLSVACPQGIITFATFTRLLSELEDDGGVVDIGRYGLPPQCEKRPWRSRAGRCVYLRLEDEGGLVDQGWNGEVYEAPRTVKTVISAMFLSLRLASLRNKSDCPL